MTKEITIADKTFELYIPHSEILRTITRLAEKINTDYKGKDVIIIGVLNGAFMFVSDLVKHLSEEINVTVAFIKVSSYHGATETSGKINTILGLDIDITGKNVIIVEDILDTLTTINNICAKMCEQKPETLQVFSLLSKQKVVDATYGQLIDNEFVIGYGLDYQGLGRNLKDIYKLKI